jgi:N-acetylglutamate synthase-like GNAT family acetyltransferase
MFFFVFSFLKQLKKTSSNYHIRKLKEKIKLARIQEIYKLKVTAVKFYETLKYNPIDGDTVDENKLENINRQQTKGQKGERNRFKYKL